MTLGDDVQTASLLYDGRHYDRIYEQFYPEVGTQDIDFLIDLANHCGSSILELCCGTGRVAIPLAEKGFQVTGIDLSLSMLEEAKRRSTAVNWVQADVTNFNLNQVFDLIIFPTNSFCHLTDLAAIEACFTCVKKHLAPNGRFLIDLFNFFNPEMLSALVSRERQHLSAYEDPDGRGTIVVTYTNDFDLAKQVNRNTFFFKLPEQAEEVTETVMFRYFFPQELAILLKYNGFKIESWFGDYHKAPFTLNSFSQLLVCSLET